MSFVSIGDLAMSMQVRRDNARLNADILRLSQELSSGRSADLRNKQGGDYGPLAALERTLVLLASDRTAADEAAQFTAAAGAALEAMQGSLDAMIPGLLISQTAAQPDQIAAIGTDAAQRFDAMVALLNTQSAGRSLFAGSQTDGPALRPDAKILDDLQTAVAGATTAADVETALTAWFAPSGGFETTDYLGGLQPLAGFRLSDGELTELPMTALAPEIRDALKSVALAALLDRGALTGYPDQRQDLARRAAETMLTAQNGVVSLRTATGASSARIETAAARFQSEAAATEIAFSRWVSADPYETALALEAARNQLETLYSVTARLSRLSLADYLR